MERRIYVSFGGVRAQPIDTNLRPEQVTVRAGDSRTVAVHDGVWIRGQRAYETWVLVDGIAKYHAPAERIARASFDEHERMGGGHPL